MRKRDGDLTCPSAQPDMPEARVFGVISGSVEEPRLAYLEGKTLVPDADSLRQLGDVHPTQVFRFAARCEQSACAHFDGARCGLAQRIVQKLEPVVDTLPPCLVRYDCRWFAEQGGEACRRCPQVVTVIPKAEDLINEVSKPH